MATGNGPIREAWRALVKALGILVLAIGLLIYGNVITPTEGSHALASVFSVSWDVVKAGGAALKDAVGQVND